MNFRQLEAFVFVVQYRSFSKAAEELYLSQPTVSTHISSLEEELGVQLITRSSKVVTPTCAGMVFYEYAHNLLQLRSQAIQSMQRYPELLQSALEIASSSVPAEYLLPGAMAAFHKTYPQVLFSVRESGSERVVQQLLTGEVELGFTGTLIHHENCLFEPLVSDNLVIVTPNTPEFQKLPRNQFPSELLRTSPFLLRMAGSGTRKEADSFLINNGISPAELTVCAYLDSMESIKQGILNGMGISILSEIAVQNLEQQGRVLVFRSENRFMHRKLYCVSRNDKPLSPVAELFLNYMKGNYSDTGRSPSSPS